MDAMTDELFVLALGCVLLTLIAWACRVLPGERWQFVATVPVRKSEDGSWSGVNLTWYGALTALSQMAAIGIAIVMAGAVEIGLDRLATVVALFGLVVVPSARWVARLVEGKAHTFTVCGAVFVAVLVLPAGIGLVNLVLRAFDAAPMPVLPLLGVVAVAYCFGEGLGRSACISFGCCYGKPVSETRGMLRKVCSHAHFVFEGGTKKIAYADRLDSVPVVPVQTITAVLYIGTGILCLWLWLRGEYAWALDLAMTVTQAWRVHSEFLRADHRGGGRFTTYQKMAIATAALCVGYAIGLDGPGLPVPVLTHGLSAFWAPGTVLMLQTVGLLSFAFCGRSEVTSARLTIAVREDRV